jgi:hypothetical protein
LPHSGVVFAGLVCKTLEITLAIGHFHLKGKAPAAPLRGVTLLALLLVLGDQIGPVNAVWIGRHDDARFSRITMNALVASM